MVANWNGCQTDRVYSRKSAGLVRFYSSRCAIQELYSWREYQTGGLFWKECQSGGIVERVPT
jgi:hypothetical protein